MFTTVVEVLSVVDGIFPDNIDCRTNKKIGINKCRSGDGGVGGNGGSPPPPSLPGLQLELCAGNAQCIPYYWWNSEQEKLSAQALYYTPQTY